MKKTLATAALGLTLALSACAPNGTTTISESETSAPTSTSTATPTPTQTPTVHVAVEVVLEGNRIAWSDIVTVAERGDVPVILLPASLDAEVVLVGAPDEWSTSSFLRVFPNGDGSITIKPQAKYNAFATPTDFVGKASGTIHFQTADSDIALKVKEVQP